MNSNNQQDLRAEVYKAPLTKVINVAFERPILVDSNLENPGYESGEW